MGVGGHFWDLLKPHARFEGFDFLRNKRVAVDLSYWIVQHETAIKGFTRKPHIRLTFFRTINLFSKFGAYPVFVLDGTPSPLKSRARIMRFFRASGADLSSLPEADEGVSVERNNSFRKCVEECVELLELLGMPVLKAKGEAEALCAQLNREGHVDACITADSDAFLYGAQCEPLECYHVSDIETGLGLKRNHLIAVSLLVGNDHDLNGITGIGVDKAVRFVKSFDEDEILNRLRELARGDIGSEFICFSSDEKSPKQKKPHCSYCGHPGKKKAHFEFSCEFCNSIAGQSCTQKSDRIEKAKKKDSTWRLTICQKIASQQKFPCNEIIQMYLRSHNGVDDEPNIVWSSPNTEMLVDYLAYQQHWEPSYIRQRLIPMLSTIYLRKIFSGPKDDDLLYGQYEFHGIQRVKTRYGHRCFVVNWKKKGSTFVRDDDADSAFPEESSELDEVDVPYIRVEGGYCILSTDEDMELVQKAFPEKTSQFLKEKELKEMKSRKKKGTPEKTESPGVQLSITEFFRSSKTTVCQKKPEENAGSSRGSSEGKRKDSSSRISKSVRRRLLFG
ncbi:flap endonuclease GEN-like 1 [Striga asiatica]|uniref:Flap endonuclease GEN-like 1 n=1 Tax=Striga asiatica TaxID=4170 RepID=A0A5A7PG78_STRAF|nr:flap endonuclease GEN-like 1 [Striga asiatica]